MNYKHGEIKNVFIYKLNIQWIVHALYFLKICLKLKKNCAPPRYVNALL
jgi:hypothetical protein